MGIRRLGRPTGFNYPVGLSVATSNTVVDYLVVAGGGGGGPTYGGGGGAGGYRTASGHPVTTGTSYSITVGAGGPGNANGSPSVFDTITSLGAFHFVVFF